MITVVTVIVDSVDIFVVEVVILSVVFGAVGCDVGSADALIVGFLVDSVDDFVNDFVEDFVDVFVDGFSVSNVVVVFIAI